MLLLLVSCDPIDYRPELKNVSPRTIYAAIFKDSVCEESIIFINTSSNNQHLFYELAWHRIGPDSIGRDFYIGDVEKTIKKYEFKYFRTLYVYADSMPTFLKEKEMAIRLLHATRCISVDSLKATNWILYTGN